MSGYMQTDTTDDGHPDKVSLSEDWELGCMLVTTSGFNTAEFVARLDKTARASNITEIEDLGSSSQLTALKAMKGFLDWFGYPIHLISDKIKAIEHLTNYSRLVRGLELVWPTGKQHA